MQAILCLYMILNGSRHLVSLLQKVVLSLTDMLCTPGLLLVRLCILRFTVQEPAVREAAVDALVALYEDEGNVLPLHEFTTRFRPRIGELIYDIDDNVAVKGVRNDLHHSPKISSSRHSDQNELPI